MYMCVGSWVFDMYPVPFYPYGDTTRVRQVSRPGRSLERFWEGHSVSYVLLWVIIHSIPYQHKQSIEE